MLSLGDPLADDQRPISAALLALIILSLLWPYLPRLPRPLTRRRGAAEVRAGSPHASA